MSALPQHEEDERLRSADRHSARPGESKRKSSFLLTHPRIPVACVDERTTFPYRSNRNEERTKAFSGKLTHYCVFWGRNRFAIDHATKTAWTAAKDDSPNYNSI